DLFMAMAKKRNAGGSEICSCAAKKSRVRFGDTPTTSPTCKLSMTKKTCAHTAAVSGLRIRTRTTAAVALRTKNTLRQRLKRRNSSRRVRGVRRFSGVLWRASESGGDNMVKKQKHLMPQTIFVYEEEDGDEKYLVASYERDDTIDAYDKEPRLVGTYQLVEVGEIVSKAVYTKLDDD